jgi:hypothetical protein
MELRSYKRLHYFLREMVTNKNGRVIFYRDISCYSTLFNLDTNLLHMTYILLTEVLDSAVKTLHELCIIFPFISLNVRHVKMISIGSSRAECICVRVGLLFFFCTSYRQT